ncbi:MAG: MFS transporter [Acidimicrobiia bacterium]|nr:MFS transporter [Acidimicrobiia bacterium]
MTGLDTRTVNRRFLILRGLRWLPTGLLIPVFVLFFMERGFTLGEIGLITAVQGFTVFFFELPTGGLADALGRRRVLLGATLAELVAMGVLVIAYDSMWVAGLGFFLQGIYRALESGPLDSWYVDALHETDPNADIEKGMGNSGVVIGLSLAAGSLLSSPVVVLAGSMGLPEPLVLPIFVAMGLRLVEFAAMYLLMTEVRPPLGLGEIKRSLAEVPQLIKTSVGMVRASALLALLVSVELFWGFGMATFEMFPPVRLEAFTGSAEQAGAIMGPAAAAAWGASALGAALVTRFSRRIGPYRAGAILRVIQGVAVVGIGLFAGVAGVLVAYITSYLIHGASNPVHLALLHRQVESKHRTTFLSINSMVGMTAGSLGGIALGAMADAISVSVAIYLGAAVLILGAIPYLVARRKDPLTFDQPARKEVNYAS